MIDRSEIDYYRDPYWLIDPQSDPPQWVVAVPFKYKGKKGYATGTMDVDPASHTEIYQKLVLQLKNDLLDEIEHNRVKDYTLYLAQ